MEREDIYMKRKREGVKKDERKARKDIEKKEISRRKRKMKEKRSNIIEKKEIGMRERLRERIRKFIQRNERNWWEKEGQRRLDCQEM